MGDSAPSLAGNALFTPLQVGPIQLQHRIALAPLTRNRAYDDHTPSEIALTYYTQRASFPGTLLITEGTFIAPEAGGDSNVPGIWNEKHIAAWRKITDSVHAKGSFIFCQLWNLGRAAQEPLMHSRGLEVVSSGDIPLKGGGAVPRPVRRDEIPKWMGFYAQAAKNAIEAGFDGVEIHAANGYLIDQFTQDVSNNRTDEYGGSIENRCRFALEVAEAVTSAIGQDRTGLRLSPWGQFLDMRMADPIPTFSYLVQQLKARFPEFAYLHVTEPRVRGNYDRPAQEGESNDFIREIWRPKLYVTAGGFNEENVRNAVPAMGDLIAYGRYFIANPDLPLRLKKGIPFTKYNRGTFYLHGPEATEGYTDYPTAEEQERQRPSLG